MERAIRLSEDMQNVLRSNKKQPFQPNESEKKQPLAMEKTSGKGQIGDYLTSDDSIPQGGFSKVIPVRLECESRIQDNYPCIHVIKAAYGYTNGFFDKSTDELDQLRNERQILKQLPWCRNIIKIAEIYVASVRYIGERIIEEFEFHVMDKAAFNLREKMYSDLFTFDGKVEVARQIKDGLLYMFKRNIIHTDLKPENILVFKQKSEDCLTVRITDFGLAVDMSKMKIRKGFAGTRLYFPPIVLEDIVSTENPNCMLMGEYLDVWAFGLLLHELFFLALPPQYEKADLTNVCELATAAENLMYEGIQAAPNSEPGILALIDFLNQIFNKDPCNPQKLLQHPFFDFNFDKWRT
jgi:serine/threonine protein kinase